jgi:surfeit locus 1 family protein
MLKIRFDQYYFQLSWLLGLTVVAGILFLKLGFWQLHRAEEKASLLQSYQTQQTQLPQLWKAGLSYPKQYERLKVSGVYEQRFFLLDNQYHHHEWGYHVLSPLQVDSKTVVLVDRGWVKGEPLREHFPEVVTPTGQQHLEGSVYYSNKNRWVPQGGTQKIADQAWILTQFDTAMLEKILHRRVAPFMIRLAQYEPNGWIRNWQVVAMPPERHRAYAFQWFSLAGLVFIVFVVTSLKKK